MWAGKNNTSLLWWLALTKLVFRSSQFFNLFCFLTSVMAGIKAPLQFSKNLLSCSSANRIIARKTPSFITQTHPQRGSIPESGATNLLSIDRPSTDHPCRYYIQIGCECDKDIWYKLFKLHKENKERQQRSSHRCSFWTNDYLMTLSSITAVGSCTCRKSHLFRIPSVKVLPLKPWVGWYIAINATPTARNFFLAYFYPSGPFTCIFSKTSPKFFLC